MKVRAYVLRNDYSKQITEFTFESREDALRKFIDLSEQAVKACNKGELKDYGISLINEKE